jgi:hypothetical protein
VTSSQEIYAAALKDEVAPVLREAGFKGSGANFTLPSETHFATIGFQKSQYSDRDALKFTINLKVVPKAVWEEMRQQRSHLPAKPSPNTIYGNYEWNQRIGLLMPERTDRWWWVYGSEDNTGTFTEVKRALMEIGVPALRREADAT